MLRGVVAAVVACCVCACDSDRAAIPSQACSVDAITGAAGNPPAAPVGAKLTFDGWAADIRAKRVSTDLVLWFVAPNGFIVGSAKRSEYVGRQDVATHFKIPEIAMAGFRAELDTKGLPKGTYEIMIESRFDTYSVTCRGTQTITLQ